MTTSCTAYLCRYILEKVKTELPHVHITSFCIESGLSGDKSMSTMNLWRTRGFHVQAEAWIPENVLKSVLKVAFIK